MRLIHRGTDFFRRRSCQLALTMSLLLGTCLVSAFLGGCRTCYYCSVGFPTEITPSRGWLRVDMGSVDYAEFSRIAVDSSFCEAAAWYGKYRDFVRDSSKSYWSMCLYHTDKTLPGSRLLVDSIRLEYGNPPRELDVAPLCNETQAQGYNQVLCIAPIPLPKNYVGPLRGSFMLKIVSDKEGVLLERRQVTLEGGCYRQREVIESLRR
jgi:hypothetical protein